MLNQVRHLGALTGESRDTINENFAILTAMGFGAYKGGNAFFVDGTLGHDGNTGTSAKPKKTIQAAIDAAEAYDTVFVKPKKITDFTGDPTNYAETLIIPASKPHLSLVGLGSGPSQGNQAQIKKGSGTTALLAIRAAGCTIANLTFNGISSTGGGILLDDDYSTKTAFGTVIAGCHFKNCVGTTATDGRTGGAINWGAAGNAWQVRIVNNRFYKNVADIVMKGTTNTVPQDVVIQGNIFSGTSGATNATDVNIYVAADGILGLVIDSNIFPNIPNIGSGSVTDFYDIGTGTYGIISNNVFGCTALTFGGTHTGGTHPATVWIVNNKQQAAVAQEAANLSPIGYTS